MRKLKTCGMKRNAMRFFGFSIKQFVTEVKDDGLCVSHNSSKLEILFSS